MANKLQALRWLWTGKKVALKGWTEDKYLVLTQSERIINQMGNSININDYEGEWIQHFVKRKKTTVRLTPNQIKILKLLIVLRDTTSAELSVMMGKKSHFINAIFSNKTCSAQTFAEICDALSISVLSLMNENATLKDFL